MSNVLLGITAAIYAYVSWDYLKKGQGGMALAFVAYSFANLGFILHNISQK